MDQLFVQEIDDLLKMKLPKKSSISGAEWVPVYPENSSTLAMSTATTYRFRLPRRGYLSRTKGQTGAFFSVQFNTSDNFCGEPWAFIRQMKILVNGVEVHNNQYYNHYYGEWLKMKSADWLRSDGQQMGIVSQYGQSPFGVLDEDTTTGSAYATGTYFNIPIPDNYSVLTNKNNVLPLEYLDVVIEITLNNHENFLGKSADAVGSRGAVLTSGTVSNLTLFCLLVFVDPEIDNAIRAKLDMADQNDDEMFLLPVQDIRVDSQSYNFATTGTKVFIFNSVSSMCRLLQAKVSRDLADASVYKTLTGLTAGISQYQFKVDGKNVTQNPVTTASPDIAYPLYQDFVSAYNQINNDNIQMCPLPKSTFFTGASATANPAWDNALASNFSMVANLDTVSKDLTGGQKLINNLALEVTNTSAGAQSNVYLIQHSNRVIGLSRNRCRVIR